jgi:hypothetical protein
MGERSYKCDDQAKLHEHELPCDNDPQIEAESAYSDADEETYPNNDLSTVS